MLKTIDFTKPVRVPGKGTIIKNAGSDTQITLGTICVSALNFWDPRESLTTEVAYKRGRLAARISEATKPMALKAEEVTTIKDLLPKVAPPITVAVVSDMLEGKRGSGGDDEEEETGEEAKPNRTARRAAARKA